MKSIACKFGGSSVADARQIEKVKNIIQADSARRYIVVSAPGKRSPEDQKITDLLFLAWETAKNNLDPSSVITIIADRYQEIIKELGLSLNLNSELDEISQRLKEESPDYAASRGEYLNGILIAHYLGATFIDPASTIFIEHDGSLNEEKTYSALSQALSGDEIFLIPGFFGSDPKGRIKTFSRGGSDISGAIVARAIKADIYENWTDVNGLLMADPRIVDNPEPISEVSYNELRELSYMGANVLHDEAIFPVKKLNIPVHIKNTNSPEQPGTRIVAQAQHRVTPIIGLAGKKGFDAIFIQKTLMNKEIGFGRKLLEIFESNQLNFEHMPSGIDSISVIINQEELEPKKKQVLEEIRQNLKVDDLTTYEGIALIAVVGAGMAYHPGMAATVFSSLADEGINIRLIDQGASELNIIIGVEEADFDNAIKSIYRAFVKK